MRRALHPITLLLCAACGAASTDDGANPADDVDGADTDTLTSDTDPTADTDEDSDPPTFPDGTYQVRVMNLLGTEVTFAGTDADGGAVALDVAPRTFSDYESLPVGEASLVLTHGATPQPIDLSSLAELDRVVLIVGEVSGVSGVVGVREPARTAGSRTMVFATTGRTVSLNTATGTLWAPAGDLGEVLYFTHVVPGEEERLTWSTYEKPFPFTMARVPEGGIGWVVNSDSSSTGYGTWYLATRSGPVQVLPPDIPMYAYSTDSSLGASLTFEARTTFGDVVVATQVGARSHTALPYAMVPGDTTEVVATDGTVTLSAPFELASGLEHAIAVVHPVDGEPTLRFVQGNPNERDSTRDAYIILANFTSSNVDARCYHAFRGHRAPGGAISAFVAPAAALASNSSQSCNLTVAAPPETPPSTPTHDFSLPTSRFRGYHVGFVTEEDDAFSVWYAYRVTDDPNVYIGTTSASPR